MRFTSSGVSAEEQGNPMDRRARRLLTARGYDGEAHRARRVDPGDDVDLYVVAEDYHGDRLAQQGVPRDRIRLITDFDPEAQPGDPLPDPWYGDESDFEDTLAVLERAVPGLLEELTPTS